MLRVSGAVELGHRPWRLSCVGVFRDTVNGCQRISLWWSFFGIRPQSYRPQLRDAPRPHAGATPVVAEFRVCSTTQEAGCHSYFPKRRRAREQPYDRGHHGRAVRQCLLTCFNACSYWEASSRTVSSLFSSGLISSIPSPPHRAPHASCSSSSSSSLQGFGGTEVGDRQSGRVDFVSRLDVPSRPCYRASADLRFSSE